MPLCRKLFAVAWSTRRKLSIRVEHINTYLKKQAEITICIKIKVLFNTFSENSPNFDASFQL